MKIKINLWLILILSFGFFLRFYRLSELAMFVGDQGRDYLAAKEILINRRLTLIGPQTSVKWLYLGPFFYYFLAFFLWLGNFNPVWPIYGTAAFGVLAIYLIYVLGKELFDEKVGLVASFFYAISPFAVLQSRISLHPSIYPVFVILFLLSLFNFLAFRPSPRRSPFGKLRITVRGVFGFTGRWFLILVASFLIAIQLHLSAVLLVPIFVLSWEQVRLKSRYFLKLFLTAVGLMVVWKIFKHSPFTSFSFWWKMFQEIFSYGDPWGAFLALIIVAVGVIRVVGGVGDKEGIKDVGRGAKLLKVCLLVTVLGLTVKNSSAEHYFNLFLPIIILVLSFGLVHLLKFRWGKVIVFIVMLISLITNYQLLITSNYFSRFYGPNLSQRIKLAKFIVNDSSGQPFVLIRCGPLWDFASTNMNYEYLVWWLGGNEGNEGDEGGITYYIFEPREAWKTKEGCLGVEVDKSFEFEQAILVKKSADSLLR